MPKLLKKLIQPLFGDRTDPGIANVTMVSFLSLKQGIKNFVERYVTPPHRVLDFGCGNMIYKKFFVEKGVADYVGIDIGDSPEFNEKYVVYTGGKTPFKDSEFDAVISTQVFEHLEDPLFYGEELERVTKNGGYLFITIAHVWEYHAYPKHYFNIFYDAIPLIFKNSKIIEVKGDMTNIQNSFHLFFNSVFRKNRVLGVLFAMVVNSMFCVLDVLKISKIEPVDYFQNPMTGSIMITLQVKK